MWPEQNLENFSFVKIVKKIKNCCPNFLPSSSAKNSPNLSSQHSQLAKAAKKRTSKKHTDFQYECAIYWRSFELPGHYVIFML